MSAVQKCAVLVLLGQILLRNKARLNDGFPVFAADLIHGVAAVVGGFPDLQSVGRDEEQPRTGVGGAIEIGDLSDGEVVHWEDFVAHAPGLHDGGVGGVSALGCPVVVGAVVDVLACLVEITEGGHQLHTVDPARLHGGLDGGVQTVGEDRGIAEVAHRHVNGAGGEENAQGDVLSFQGLVEAYQGG